MPGAPVASRYLTGYRESELARLAKAPRSTPIDQGAACGDFRGADGVVPSEALVWKTPSLPLEPGASLL